MPETVIFEGGPFDGCEVDVHWGTTYVAGGGPLADGIVARYRPSRRRGVYTFRGMDRVVATFPAPGDGDDTVDLALTATGPEERGN